MLQVRTSFAENDAGRQPHEQKSYEKGIPYNEREDSPYEISHVAS